MPAAIGTMRPRLLPVQIQHFQQPPSYLLQFRRLLRLRGNRPEMPPNKNA
jgi:hypothetical protein